MAEGVTALLIHSFIDSPQRHFMRTLLPRNPDHTQREGKPVMSASLSSILQTETLRLRRCSNLPKKTSFFSDFPCSYNL